MKARVAGASVRGAAHRRDGRPNQDAIAWWPPSGVGANLVLAVADGHGDKRSARSDKGAQLAVAVATRLGEQFLAVLARAEDDLHAALLADHGQRTVRWWYDAVKADIAAHPFTDEEVDQCTSDAGGLTPAAELVAYGATLLMLLVTDTRAFTFQLGDGDVLVVDRDLAVDRPGTDDERFLADETTSLCQPKAWEEFVITTIDLANTELVVLSTDGCSKSFETDDGFRQVAIDLHRMLGKGGIGAVEAELADLLADLSDAGSGDDVTVGLVDFVARHGPPESPPSLPKG